MAARPSVSKIPPKKLQPSKWPFPVSGSGSGTAVLGVGLDVDVVVVDGLLVAVVVAVVVVGVVVVVVGIVGVVVSGIGVVIVVVVIVVVVVVSVVVDAVVVVVSAGVVVVVSEELVVVVSAGVVVMTGSSPDPEQSSVVLNSLGVTGSEDTASVTSWQVSEVSSYLTNMQPVTATHASQSRLGLQVGLLGVVLGGVDGGSVGRARVWQPRARQSRMYPSMVAWLLL